MEKGQRKKKKTKKPKGQKLLLRQEVEEAAGVDLLIRDREVIHHVVVGDDDHFLHQDHDLPLRVLDLILARGLPHDHDQEEKEAQHLNRQLFLWIS